MPVIWVAGPWVRAALRTGSGRFAGQPDYSGQGKNVMMLHGFPEWSDMCAAIPPERSVAARRATPFSACRHYKFADDVRRALERR